MKKNKMEKEKQNCTPERINSKVVFIYLFIYYFAVYTNVQYIETCFSVVYPHFYAFFMYSYLFMHMCAPVVIQIKYYTLMPKDLN